MSVKPVASVVNLFMVISFGLSLNRTVGASPARVQRQAGISDDPRA